MLYEIAHLENGEIVRGGIKAEIRTVGRWIEKNSVSIPDIEFFAIPANSEALTISEYMTECKDGNML